MVDLLQPIKCKFLGQLQVIINPCTQWSGRDTIYQQKDMSVLFLMKLVSSNLDIEVKRYDSSTSDYQKQIFGSTSNNHNSSYTMIWVRYYISTERYESSLSNEIGFILFGYRSKTLWLIYFRLSKQSTKGQIRELFDFLGAFWSFSITQNLSKPYIKAY